MIAKIHLSRGQVKLSGNDCGLLFVSLLFFGPLQNTVPHLRVKQHQVCTKNTRPTEEFEKQRCAHTLHRVCGKRSWVFPKIVVPQNGWFIRENPIKVDDLGVPLFLETPR